MRFIIISTLILGILLVVYFSADAVFRESFWPNFVADSIVAAVFGFMINQFTDLTKKPYLTMVIKQGSLYSDVIKWTKAVNGEYETSFRVGIKNTGNKMLKPGEGYWHLYFPEIIKIDYVDGADEFISSDKGHLRQIINLPIFPNSFLDIGPEFKIKTSNIATFKIYYFFSTEYGYFPKTVKMNQETSEIQYNTMGSFPIKVI